MDAKDFIAKLKSDLVAVRGSGRKTVHIEALLSYLVQSERDAGGSLELWKLEYDFVGKSKLELFRSVIDAGKDALNSSMLINGGAVVAVLSFLGAALSKGVAGSLGSALSTSLLAFGIGVLCSALAFGMRYVTQYAYGNNAKFAGHVLLVCTAVLATGAYASFGFGVYKAYLAFAAYFAVAP